ncbi:PREDICTED: uncharacterized protein LOC109361817 [Lupinus angustifolius]|uniref:uncharacterized protein LOC109361817 n=1 Tax=Lupinus angustifolius TaxID=3871 RepID=UPI00092F15F6|nr:PREDICTED: uncharacterized protein LOC109361817 [Lupinus angustifolius]
MAKQHSDRQQFSANTQPNPKEHYKPITTRSGKVIGRGIGENLAVEEKVIEEIEVEKGDNVIREAQKDENVQKYDRIANKEESMRENNDKRKSDLPQLKDLPYPRKPSKRDKERRRNRTLEAGCNAIIQKSLLKKTKDPCSFTISVTIDELSLGKALLDLGVSINPMPLSMLKRIGDLEIKPTRMTLQLADRSVKYPYGVAEDVLVKVDKLLFHVDFIIMDIEEDIKFPLILGKPFMKTARGIIDVDEGKLKVRVQDQEVNFNVFEAMQHPKDKQHCFRVDVIEELYMLDDIHLSRSSPLEKL